MKKEESGGLDFYDPEGEYTIGEEIGYRVPIFKNIPIGNPHEGIITGFSGSQIVVLRTKTNTTQIINRSQVIAPSKP